MKLEETAAAMLSDNYKERFRAEYWQLAIRIESLSAFLVKWEKGELGFSPDCPKDMLEYQLQSMFKYLDVLKERAKIECIFLESYVDKYSDTKYKEILVLVS